MEHIILTLTLLKLATVALGSVFLWHTIRAYRKHGAPSLLWLSLAIGTLIFAAVAEGFSLQVMGLPLDAAHIVEAVFTLLGFLILVWSVVSHRIE